MMKKLILLPFLLAVGALFGQGIAVSYKAKDNHTGKVQRVRFLDNHTIAYSREYSGAFRFINLSKLEVRKSFSGLRGRIDGFEFSNNKKYMVGTMKEGEVGLWSVRSEKLIYGIGEFAPYYYSPQSLFFYPSDDKFHVFEGCSFMIYDRKSGQLIDSIMPLESDCMYECAITADQKRFYAGGNDSIWAQNPESGEILAQISANGLSVVTDVALSPNEEMLAVAGRKGLWLLDPNLNKIFNLEGHEDWVGEVTFSPDNKYLYSCSGSFQTEEGEIRIWNTKTGKCEAVFKDHQEQVRSIDVSPNGRWLISGSDDRTIRIWSTKNQMLVATIIPALIDGKEDFFIHIPSGAYLGPQEFFEHARVSYSGQKITDISEPKMARKAIKKALKRGS